MRTIINASVLVSNGGVRLSSRFVTRVITAGLILFLLNILCYATLIVYYEIKITKIEIEYQQKGYK